MAQESGKKELLLNLHNTNYTKGVAGYVGGAWMYLKEMNTEMRTQEELKRNVKGDEGVKSLFMRKLFFLTVNLCSEESSLRV